MEVLRGNAEDEIRQRVIGAGAIGEEIEFAVHDEIESGIVAVGRNPGTHFPVVPSVDVGERI